MFSVVKNLKNDLAAASLRALVVAAYFLPCKLSKYRIIAWYVSSDHIYVWWKDLDARPKMTNSFVFTPGRATTQSGGRTYVQPDFVWPPIDEVSNP